MKLRSAACVAAVLISMSAHAGQPATAEPDQALRETLVAMGTADQAVRQTLGPFLRRRDMKSAEFNAVVREMTAIDARNLAELEKIVSLHGWPRIDRVGVEASNSAYLILQHSPLDAQKRLLPRFREAVMAGEARAADLAMLEDRIRTGEGKKQLFGTQVTAGPDGVPRPEPIEEPSQLDTRRKSVGLPPIDEYLDVLETQIGRAIDRSALQVVR